MAMAKLALPANYRAVLDVIERAGCGSHLTTQQIWERARASHPTIGFATVHRALARLHRSGDILKIDVPGESAAFYEPLSDEHAHFRCTACKAVSDFGSVLSPAAVAALAQAHGVTIGAVAVNVSGVCAACR